MEDLSMDKNIKDKTDLIIRLTERLLDAEDKLADALDRSDHFYNQYWELKMKYEPNGEDF